MSDAVILHTFLRLARPGTILTLFVFILVFPAAVMAILARAQNTSIDFSSILSMFTGGGMITIVAFTFISSSIGNTQSLNDGEYMSLLFSRPLFRWVYIFSKWLAGSFLTSLVVGLQILNFAFLLSLIGRGNQFSIEFIDVGNLLLNSFAASALVIMLYSFPSKIGAMLFAAVLYFSFAAPLMLESFPGMNTGILHNTINTGCNILRSLVYSPIDLDQYFNSIKIMWLPALAFISNLFLYLCIAVMVINKREFFYNN